MNSEIWRDQRQNIDNEYYRRESVRKHEIYISYDHQHVHQERFARGFRPHRDVGKIVMMTLRRGSYIECCHLNTMREVKCEGEILQEVILSKGNMDLGIKQSYIIEE